MCGFFRGIWSFFTKQTPKRIDHRKEGGQAALVLVHGFTGDTRATWAKFVDLLLANARIKTWDLFGLGYPSSLRIDVPDVWAADPGIEKLALGLVTTLKLSQFSGYKAIAIAAHSMGGLVVQRAILDDPELDKRISHLFFFGTPSAGLDKAERFTSLKRQIEDMDSKGSFIAALRRDWNARFSAPPPFFFRTVAGDRDEFVPASSSIEPFPDAFRAVVPGNHLEIKPPDAENQSFLLVVDALVGGPQRERPEVDSARLAVELRDFRKAADIWLPDVARLDDDALGSLALALEGLGEGKQALSILEEHFKKAKGGISSLDAQGILAGRLKRRWLVGRAKDDLVRARKLYGDALKQSEIDNNHSQAYYHAINVAFLDLMATPPNSDIPASVAEMAKCAQKHCAQVPEQGPGANWRFATEAEAFLMLRNLDGAETLYRRAKALTTSPREIGSMCMQAIRVANRIFGRPGAARIETVFGLGGGGTAQAGT